MGCGCLGGDGAGFGGRGVVGWTVDLEVVGVVMGGSGIWIFWGHGVGRVWVEFEGYAARIAVWSFEWLVGAQKGYFQGHSMSHDT
jgi:hypothetical protein